MQSVAVSFSIIYYYSLFQQYECFPDRCAYGGHDAAVEVLLNGGADANIVVDDEQGNKLTAVSVWLHWYIESMGYSGNRLEFQLSK